MNETVLVLGAKGRFGRAAVAAFREAGWSVRAFARAWDDDGTDDVTRVAGDAFDPRALTEAAAGCDVIVNALNPPYPQWSQDLPRITASVIAAAKASGAAVMIPGNVYNYREDMPARLTETTPHVPTTRKGKLRETMEQTYRAAAAEGVRTVILRGGDFIESTKTGNWFDGYIAARVDEGRAVYPGPLDQVHAWAYLPDMARAMVGLADKRHGFAPFETFGFAGYAVTGRELVGELEAVAGRSLKIGAMPWTVIRLLGLVRPLMREVAEMRYLWDVPHAIDGGKLATTLPDFRPTPMRAAIAEAIGKPAPKAPLRLATAA